MGIAKGERYTFRAALRGENFSGPLIIKVISADGKELASGEIKGASAMVGNIRRSTSPLLMATRKQSYRSPPAAKAFCSSTWFRCCRSRRGRTTGLRPDLAEAMDALKPTLFRFPGGCWAEGDTMDKAYDWKKTIGNIDARTPLWNIWQYNATHSIGYHEYLQMSEDLGAEPLFCINVGMSHKEIVPMDQMGRWVQDALDALEYANGPTNTFWGGLRAKNGHPAPFNMKFMEIGNENAPKPTTNAGPCSTMRSKPNTPTCNSSPMTGRATFRIPEARSRGRALLQHPGVFHAAGASLRQI